MMNQKKQYVIGVDFGTLSGRTVLVCLKDGSEVASSVMDYPHGVMERELARDIQGSCGTKLKLGSALQDPQDYLDVLEWTVRDVVKRSGVDPKDVVGMGIDATSSTLLPVAEDGTPMCALDCWKSEPHAYVKLWKHHGVQEQATRVEAAARAVGGDQEHHWLGRYGDQVSAEWALPKILETLEESEDLYRETAYFMEVADWIVWNLIGELKRSSAMMGYKYFWMGKDGDNGNGGFPPKAFFAAVDPRLSNLVETKLSGEIIPTGSFAGRLTAEASKRLGLVEGTAVAAALIDAHSALPILGVVSPGNMMMIMGTSTCHIVMSEEERFVPGISGVVKDGVIPGYYGYEAGQSAVGDIFAWFVENAVPKAYFDEATARKISIHALLQERAQALPPGGSGVVALDWWNGNRSILSNADLSGAIFGLTLATKPEEIYRALLEATAYGARVIRDNYRSHGVTIDEVYASGGIPGRNPLIMQIYADVLNCPISVATTPPSAGLGGAVFGAVAAGYYGSVEEAAAKMAGREKISYTPDPARAKRYDALFDVYKELHDYFGVRRSELMKQLKDL